MFHHHSPPKEKKAWCWFQQERVRTSGLHFEPDRLEPRLLEEPIFIKYRICFSDVPVCFSSQLWTAGGDTLLINGFMVLCFKLSAAGV